MSTIILIFVAGHMALAIIWNCLPIWDCMHIEFFHLISKMEKFHIWLRFSPLFMIKKAHIVQTFWLFSGVRIEWVEKPLPSLGDVQFSYCLFFNAHGQFCCLGFVDLDLSLDFVSIPLVLLPVSPFLFFPNLSHICHTKLANA